MPISGQRVLCRISDVKSKGKRDEWDGTSALYFPILNTFCLLANISTLTVINTKGKLIMGGEGPRETGKKRVLHGRGRYRRIKNPICLFPPVIKTTLARA